MEEYQFQPPAQPEPTPAHPPEPQPQVPQPPIAPKPEPRPSLAQTYKMLPEPQKRTWLWVLLGVIALAILFVAFVIYYGSLPEPSDTETETGTPAAITNLEAELQGVDLQDLGTELDDIEKELQGL